MPRLSLGRSIRRSMRYGDVKDGASCYAGKVDRDGAWGLMVVVMTDNGAAVGEANYVFIVSPDVAHC